MQPETFPEAFEDRSAVRERCLMRSRCWCLLALGWFVYSQLTAVGGRRMANEPRSIVDVIPMDVPPPPPPPPPPPGRSRPSRPSSRSPAPSEAPKSPQPQAAPVSIAAPAQAGTDAFGVTAGTGQGNGAPSSSGTCLGNNCGSRPSGNGMTEGFYRQYLSSTLEERVRGDDKLSRLVFSADLALTVTEDGRITGVRLLGARGRSDDETMRKLTALLGTVRGLNAPPSDMVFPQRVTVRGPAGDLIMISRHAANFVARPVRHLPNGRRRNADRALAASVALAASALVAPLPGAGCAAAGTSTGRALRFAQWRRAFPANVQVAVIARETRGGSPSLSIAATSATRCAKRIEADPAFAEAPFSAVIAVVVTPAGAVDDVRVLESSGDPRTGRASRRDDRRSQGARNPTVIDDLSASGCGPWEGRPPERTDNIQSRDPRNAGALKETKGVN